MLTNIRTAYAVPRDWLVVAHPHLLPTHPEALVKPCPLYSSPVTIPICYTDMQTLDNGWRLGLSPCGTTLYFTPPESAKRRRRKLAKRAAAWR